MNEIILPALFTLCAALGITKPQCKPDISLSGMNQVDKSLWVSGTEGSPDNKPSPWCYKAIAIARYQMFDGRWGTTYACHAPPEDDTVTADELNAITKAAARLNGNHQKTLLDHETAMSLKHWAASLAGRPGS